MNQLHLIQIVQMIQLDNLGLLVDSNKLHSGIIELGLLHVSVDSLIEVLTHVGFENDGEVISEPMSLRGGIQSENHLVEVVRTECRPIACNLHHPVESVHALNG